MERYLPHLENLHLPKDGLKHVLARLIGILSICCIECFHLLQLR